MAQRLLTRVARIPDIFLNLENALLMEESPARGYLDHSTQGAAQFDAAGLPDVDAPTGRPVRPVPQFLAEAASLLDALGIGSSALARSVP